MNQPNSIPFVEDLGAAFEQVLENEVRATGSSSRIRQRTLTYRVAGAVSVVLMGAVVFLAGRGSVDEEQLMAQAEQFASVLPRVMSDYNPVAGPDELAMIAQLSAIGRIEGFNEGRTYVDQGRIVGETAVMVVAVEKVMHGEMPDPSHSQLYFEVRLNNVTSVATLNAAVPDNARVLVYASREGEFLHPRVGEGRGLAPGQPMMAATGPQGFFLQLGDLTFVGFFSHGARLVARGMSLEDFAPPGDVWPVPLEP